jgi:hypothetical protein
MGKSSPETMGFSHELREVPVKIAPKKSKFHWKTKEVSPGKKGDFPGDPSKGETLRNFDRFVAFVCGPHIFFQPSSRERQARLTGCRAAKAMAAEEVGPHQKVVGEVGTPGWCRADGRLRAQCGGQSVYPRQPEDGS